MVLPGSILGGVGCSLGSIGSHLVSFWVPQAVKIQTVEDQADIGKTYENHWFSLIFEGWKVSGGDLGVTLGSLGILLDDLVLTFSDL